MTTMMNTVDTNSELEEESSAIVRRASELVVTDAESRVFAGDALKEIKTFLKRVDAEFKEPVASAKKAYDDIRVLRAKISDPAERAETIIKSKCISYEREQERIRLAAEAKIREEARKLEEARVLEQAAALERSGEKAAAEAMIAEPIQAPAIVLPKSSPKVSGQSLRKVYKFRVVDESKIPREYLKVDEVKIGQYARMQKEAAKLDGVEFYSEDVMSSTGF